MDEFLMTYEEVLERVDEYTLYCFYLGFQPRPGVCYHSPIRPDPHASWTFFESSRSNWLSYKWKDQARGNSGDIYDLVQGVCKLSSRYDAKHRIMTDFGLLEGTIGEKIVRFEQPLTVPVDFKVRYTQWTQQGLFFYERQGITLPTLQRYNTGMIDCYWSSTSPYPRFTSKLAFAYRIDDRYKIYQPGDKEKKFRTSYRENDVEGWQQLRGRTKLCLITKSTKECMFFDEVCDIDAVASRGEHMRIPQEHLDLLIGAYDVVAVWNDNDGKESSDKFYPDLPKLYVPRETGCKDPTDYCKPHGPAAARAMVYNQIDGQGLFAV